MTPRDGDTVHLVDAKLEQDWTRRTEDCWDEVRRVLPTREQTIEYELPPAEMGGLRRPARTRPRPPCAMGS
ncbi:hypothetical protein [Streptomyces sp. NPDC058092]|uniref:hypothetical protein n=1 Tax=Streptomyces sp. NPDC058092 TaxID=3346336 RepID=UPI0036EBF282